MYFSVIIPLYNKERHIERAITSVLNQKYKNFEIIIVDDGSTDNSAKIVEEISSTKVKLIRQKNKGVSSARNTGIYNASYKYICFLDADDAWKPMFLKVAKNLIEKYPMAGIYGTSYESVDQFGETFTRVKDSTIKKNKSSEVNYFKESINNNPILSASSVVIPKYVFEELGGFPEGIFRGEDQDMWTRIALNYSVVVINKVCVRYYLDADNRASNTKNIYSKSFISYAENLLEKEKKNREYNFYFEEYMIMHILKKARYLINQNQSKEAKKILKKYKYTKCNKLEWLKSYILSFKLPLFLYKKIR